MKHSGITIAATLVPLSLLASGCSPYWKGKLGSTPFISTGAETRLITGAPAENRDALGVRVRPKDIICAEPSPDVVKAVTDKLTIDSNKLGHLTAEQRESIVQLTQRIATIQLLRDQMYRACEAYANGILSETTYAALISRLADPAMVTMLLGETAAREGQAPDTDPNSPLPTTKKNPTGTDAGDPGKNKSASEGRDGRDEPLSELARKYIENIDFKPVIFACISALDRSSEGERSEFQTYCKDNLPVMIRDMTEILRIKVDGYWSGHRGEPHRGSKRTASISVHSPQH